MPFLGRSGPQKRDCQFRLRFCSDIFLFGTGNTLFLGKLVQKIKIVSLSWNVVPRLILICQIKWWVHCFYFRSKTLFWGKFGLKNQNCQFKLKLYLLLSLIQVCRIQCWCSLFLFLTGNTLFGQIWSKNSNLSV